MNAKKFNLELQKAIQLKSITPNWILILYKNDKRVIDNNTLASLTLLIAESNPKEKEILVDLITNFLN